MTTATVNGRRWIVLNVGLRRLRMDGEHPFPPLDPRLFLSALNLLHILPTLPDVSLILHRLLFLLCFLLIPVPSELAQGLLTPAATPRSLFRQLRPCPLPQVRRHLVVEMMNARGIMIACRSIPVLPCPRRAQSWLKYPPDLLQSIPPHPHQVGLRRRNLYKILMITFCLIVHSLFSWWQLIAYT